MNGPEKEMAAQGLIVRAEVIPKISNCAMDDCSFNTNHICHAKSISVGDDHQKCDTYSASEHKSGEGSVIGGVGSCKVVKCLFNKGGMLCGAGGITISRHDDHADCLMFKSI